MIRTLGSRNELFIAAQNFLFFCVFFVILFCCHHCTNGEFPSNNNYQIRNVENNLCLTSNENDFRTEVGVFLGQVTLENCDLTSTKQKWGIILWSTKNGKNQYWFYPKENGLNELTAVLDEEGVYPVNNFIEVTELDLDGGSRANIQRFLFKSLEFRQCLASQGRSHPISYENCDLRRRDQQWRLELYPEDPPKKSISQRTLIGLTIDFGKFALEKYFPAIFPSSSSKSEN